MTICTYLIEKNAQKRALNNKKQNVLHIAAENGKTEVLKYLLEIISIEQDDNGNTPLHLSAKNGHKECCVILLPKAKTLLFKENRNGKTPLDLAFENNQEDVFGFLLENMSILDTEKIIEKYIKIALKNKEKR